MLYFYKAILLNSKGSPWSVKWFFVREPNLGNFRTSHASEDTLSINNLNTQERLAITNINEKTCQTNIETVDTSTSTPTSQSASTSTSTPNSIEVATQIASIITVDSHTETIFQKL